MNGKISARDLSQKVVLAFPFERRKFLSGAGQSLVVTSAVLPRQIEMIAAKAHRLTDRNDFFWWTEESRTKLFPFLMTCSLYLGILLLFSLLEFVSSLLRHLWSEVRQEVEKYLTCTGFFGTPTVGLPMPNQQERKVSNFESWRLWRKLNSLSLWKKLRGKMSSTKCVKCFCRKWCQKCRGLCPIGLPANIYERGVKSWIQ